jgi:hypothetical protein
MDADNLRTDLASCDGVIGFERPVVGIVSRVAALGRKAVPATLAAVAAAAIALPTSAGAAIYSKVTLSVQGAHFKGKVSSPRDRCVVGRKVLIKRPAPGKDTIVTRTFATESGSYNVLIPMQSGRHLYAKIRRFQPPGRSYFCAPDRSPTVTG